MDRSLALIEDQRQYKAYGDCFIIEFDRSSEEFGVVGASSKYIYYKFESLEEASLKKDKMHNSMETLRDSLMQMVH